MSRFPFLTPAARWMVLGAIVAIPWPYAGVPQWVQPWIGGWLLAALALWVAGRVLERRWPRVPRLLWVPVALLVLQGWLLLANAQYRYDWQSFDFVPAHPWCASPWTPGALDTMEAGPAMLRLTGVLAALVMMAEMARRAPWRRRLFGALLVSGLAVAAVGLLQRVLHSSLGLWEAGDEGHNYFASFYYHGNAGAFINLLIPALALLALRRPNAATIGALLLGLAASVAIASKAAMVFTGLLAGTVFLWEFRRRGRVKTPVLLGLLLFAALVPFGFERARERWAQIPLLLHWDNPRLLAWQACLRMLPDAGPWGIGLTNFKLAFPHYTWGLEAESIRGFWEHAHQDYLQTAIEWGWVGFVLWAIVLLGPCRRGAGLIHRSALLALTGLLVHALLDYPFQIPALQLCGAGWLALLWGGVADRRARG